MDDQSNMPAQLNAEPALLRATIQITRKGTGKVEEYQIVGTVPPGSVPQNQAKPAEEQQ